MMERAARILLTEDEPAPAGLISLAFELRDGWVDLTTAVNPAEAGACIEAAPPEHTRYPLGQPGVLQYFSVPA